MVSSTCVSRALAKAIRFFVWLANEASAGRYGRGFLTQEVAGEAGFEDARRA